MPLGAGFLSWLPACRTIEKKAKFKDWRKQWKTRKNKNSQKSLKNVSFWLQKLILFGDFWPQKSPKRINFWPQKSPKRSGEPISLGVGANMRTVRDPPTLLGQCPIFHRFLVLKASRIREYYKNKYFLVAFSQLIFEHNSLGQVPRLFNQSWLGNLLFNFQTRAWDLFLITHIS